MKIIGHRGAAGISLENTKSSLEAAVKSLPSAIEIDIRKTKDNHLVLCHDHDLVRMASNPIVIAEEVLKELQAVQLHHNEQLLDLRTALKIIGPIETIVELKDDQSSDLLLNVMSEFRSGKISVAAFDFDELLKLQQKNPKLRLYVLERTKPIETLQHAKASGLYGVGLNFWLLNPLTYFLARKYKLELYVYTVNSRWLVGFIRFFYPGVAICTDYPNRFTRRKRRLSRKKVI